MITLIDINICLDMVATLGETTGHLFLTRIRDQMLQSDEGRRILRERPVINTKVINFDKLKAECAPGTFGHAYVSWLESEGVTPDTRCEVSKENKNMRHFDIVCCVRCNL